jgi:hypothetical protein
MLGDSSGEVVVPKFARAAAEFLEGVRVAADKCLEAFAIRQLQVHLAAVSTLNLVGSGDVPFNG